MGGFLIASPPPRCAARRARPRALALIVALSVATLGLSQLASAGSLAPVVVTSVAPPCGALSVGVSLRVTGTAQPGYRILVRVDDPSGTNVVPQQGVDADTSGDWSLSLKSFAPRTNGYYTVTAADDANQSDFAYFSAPCRNPSVSLSPTCHGSGASRVTVNVDDFAPNANIVVTYDVGGAEQIQRASTDGNGRELRAITFSDSPPNRSIPIRVEDAFGNRVNTAWPVCLPATTLATPTTTTVTVPGATTTSTTRPLATTTTSVGPKTVAVTITPGLGPPGFVATVRGTGFPPGLAVLSWLPGIGTSTAIVGADGTFSGSLLVIPRDRLGMRLVVATAGAATAKAPFLVVPGTVQPSGQDVTQITRLRRFIQR